MSEQLCAVEFIKEALLKCINQNVLISQLQNVSTVYSNRDLQVFDI